jgi:hypothetical protein
MPYTIKSIGDEETSKQSVQSTQLPEAEVQEDKTVPMKTENSSNFQLNPPSIVPEKKAKFTIKSVPEKKQSNAESLQRYGAQGLKAGAYYGVSKIPYGPQAIMATEGAKMLMGTMAPNPEDIQLLKENFESRGIPWSKENEEAIQKGYDKAASLIPAISSGFEQAEKKGYKVEAKTPGQKAISVVLDTVAGSGNPVLKALGGGVALGLYHGLQNAGISEPTAGNVARIVGIILGQNPEGFMPIKEVEGTPISTSPGGTPPTKPTNINEKPSGISEYAEEARTKAIEKERTPEEKIAEKTLGKEELTGKKIEGAKEARGSLKTAQDILGPPIEIEQIPVKARVGEREREVTAPSTMRGKAQGRQLPVKQQTEGDGISRVAAQELGIEPTEVSSQQRTAMQNTLKREGLKLSPQPQQANPVERMTHSVTPIKAGNKEILGNNLKSVFNARERKVFEDANKLYDDARKLNENIIEDVTEMVPRLQEIHDQHINSSDPVKVDIAKEADKLIKEVSANGQPRPVSLASLIKRIQELHSGSKHKFANDPKNAYSLLTDVIEKQLDKAKGASADAVYAWKNARSFYRENYAEVFKNPESFNLLNDKNINYEELYDKLTKPSIYNFLEPQLRQSPAGIRILDAAKRDILERKFKEAFKGKTDIKQSEVRDVLDDIGINVNGFERGRIYESIQQIKNEQLALRDRTFTLSRKNLKQIEKPKQIKEKPIKEEKKVPLKERKLVDIKNKSWWKNASEKQIEAQFDSIQGIKIAEKMFADDPKYLEKLKRETAIRTITNKKVPGENTHETVERMLQDRDKEEFLEYLLGKDAVEDFRIRVKEIKKYEEDLKSYEHQQKQLQKQKETEQNKKLEKSLTEKITNTLIKMTKKEITLDVLDHIPIIKYTPRSIKNAVVEHLYEEKK